MSKKKHKPSVHPITDTMQLDETPAENTANAFQSISDTEPEEFIPAAGEALEYYDDSVQEAQYAKAEKALTIVTLVLSGLLLIGSLIFWGYFVSRLSICAITINNWELYRAMLICCGVFTLAFTLFQVWKRKSVSTEGWMINMCVSGVITSAVMIIYNLTALGNSFVLNEVITILCFSISGCALPAAIFTAIRLLVEMLIRHIQTEANKDPEEVYYDVRSQCDGRF